MTRRRSDIPSCSKTLAEREEELKKKQAENDILCGNLKCNSKFKHGEKSISCDFCSKWFHTECTELDALAYNFLSKTKYKSILWKCENCLSISAGTENFLKNQIDEVKKDVLELKNSFKENFTKLSTDLGSKNVTLKEKIQSYAEVISNNTTETNETKKVISSINTNFSNLKLNLENKIVNESEQKFIKQKELNVCIFNVPEPINNSEEENAKSDVERLKSILSDKIDIKQEDLKAIYRRGKSIQVSKPRPIIIKFANLEKKLEILKLRNLTFKSQDSMIINIHVTPDRTMKQQQELKKLVIELKKRRADGESDIFIRNDKIVHYTSPFRHQSQLLWD